MLFEPLDITRPDLFGESIDDFDAGQVALVHRAVKSLSGKCFLMDRAISIAIKQTPELVLELAHAFHRARHQGPREVLIGQPRAAFDRVHEVTLDRIFGGKRDVVAALDHARAAALAEQSLHCDRDR